MHVKINLANFVQKILTSITLHGLATYKKLNEECYGHCWSKAWPIIGKSMLLWLQYVLHTSVENHLHKLGYFSWTDVWIFHLTDVNLTTHHFDGTFSPTLARPSSKELLPVIPVS